MEVLKYTADRALQTRDNPDRSDLTWDRHGHTEAVVSKQASTGCHRLSKSWVKVSSLNVHHLPVANPVAEVPHVPFSAALRFPISVPWQTTSRYKIRGGR